jgi:hypothetical protein
VDVRGKFGAGLDSRIPDIGCANVHHMGASADCAGRIVMGGPARSSIPPHHGRSVAELPCELTPTRRFSRDRPYCATDARQVPATDQSLFAHACNGPVGKAGIVIIRHDKIIGTTAGKRLETSLLNFRSLKGADLRAACQQAARLKCAQYGRRRGRIDTGELSRRAAGRRPRSGPGNHVV